ncbi:MAG: flagellar biosynthesis anti-sigma factor FlgM [Granulosicoccus sp.]|nr:flagellar biosynthesis anti-sigma factor FlgM [Granulosicoccus sp.]
MAPPESGKTGSNVTALDDARRHRKRSTSTSPESSGNTDPGAVPDSVSGQSDAEKPDGNTTEDKPPAKPKTGNRRFDKVKVERIKAAIAKGEYRINYLQVADKFIEHERYA